MSGFGGSLGVVGRRVIPPDVPGLVLWLRGDRGITLSGATASLTAGSDFSNAAWTKTNVTVTPDDGGSGEATADLITENINAIAVEYYAQQAPTNWRTGTTTISVRAKRSDLDFICIRCNGDTVRVWYNLLTGAVGTITGTVISTSITAVANGFYLCSVTFLQTVAPASAPVLISVSRADATLSYIVAVPRSLWLWDAQVSQPDGYVSPWADQSGQGNDFAQATVTRQPGGSLIGGQPAYRFYAASSQCLVAAAPPVITPNNFTAFAAINERTTGASQHVLGINGAVDGTISPLAGGVSVGIHDGTAFRTTGAGITGEQILTWAINAVALTVQCWRGGVSLGSAAYDGTFGGAWANTVLGALTTGGAQPLDAELGELVLYDRVLSASERTRVNSYLANRYSL